MTTPSRILVAGIGNIFFGDDGFGVEVSRRLAGRPLPEGVRVVDFGIRGLDLTYALLDDYDGVVLVDTVMRGGEPGTLYVIEPEVPEEDELSVEPHGLDPNTVLAMLRTMGGEVRRLRLVGCEPAALGSDEELAMGLSAKVAAAVEPAADLVESVVAELQEAAGAEGVGLTEGGQHA